MKKMAFCLALPLALFAQNAQAAQMIYTITGDYEASFVLDQMPTAGPDASAPDYFFTDPTDDQIFYITNVTGSFGGHSGLGGLSFYTDAADGGLTIAFLNPNTNLYDIVNLTGAQLFTGDVAAPILLAFGPTGFDDYDTPGAKSYTLTAKAVPEPASWAMMIGGLGLMGAAMRRRPSAKIAFA